MAHLCRPAFALAFIALAAGYFVSAREVRHGPGPVAPDRPAQAPISNPRPIERDDLLLRPRAFFRAEARVLGRERYRFDAMASLSPIDLALGWGPMSDERVLDRIDVSQGQRFSFYIPEEPLSISPALLVLTQTNVHTIAANPEIAATLRGLRRGQVIRVEGMLVDVERDGRRIWKTSLERTDSGPGACEILFTTRLRVVEPRRL